MHVGGRSSPFLPLLQALHVPAQEADEFSDSDVDDGDERCIPWYGVFGGEQGLPAPGQDFARYLDDIAAQVSLMAKALPDLHVPQRRQSR